MRFLNREQVFGVVSVDASEQEIRALLDNAGINSWGYKVVDGLQIFTTKRRYTKRVESILAEKGL